MPRRRRSALTRILHGLASGGREVFGAQARQLQRESLLEQAGEQRGELREEDFRRQLALAGVQIPQDQPISLQDVSEQIRTLKAAGVKGLEQLEAEALARARGTAVGTLAGGPQPKTPEELEAEALASARGAAAGTLQGGPSIEDLMERARARAAGTATGTLEGGPDIERIRAVSQAQAAGTLAGGPAPKTPDQIEEEALVRARGTAAGRAEGTPAGKAGGSEAVRRARAFANAAGPALQQLESFEEEALSSLFFRRAPLTPNVIRSSKFQQFDAAMESFIRNIVIAKSGAQFSAEELERTSKSLRPVLGDSADAIRTKARLRRIELNSILDIAGVSTIPLEGSFQIESLQQEAGSSEPPDDSVLDRTALEAFLDQGGDPSLLTNAQLSILAPESRR